MRLVDDRLLRRGLRLEYGTLAWNVVGVAVVAVAAVHARSVALAGFGVDSLIEIFASMVVVWELTGSGGADRERKAMHMIGAAFLALALWLLVQATWVLATAVEPETSALGIGWTALTCAVMVALSIGKTATGNATGNVVLCTEGRVTLIDAYLAGAVLVGLVAHATLGWWWADPLAGYVIVFYGTTEGLAAWRHR